jgi:hypothetical protein
LSKVFSILFYGHESTFSSRCEGMPCKRFTVAFLLVIFALMLVVEPSPVHAAASLVQQNKTYCMSNWSAAPCTSATMSVSFANSVASGDVVLVGVHSGSSISITVSSVSDSLGSSFTQAVMSSNLIGAFVYEYIYYATLSSSGSDQITVTFSSPPTEYSTVFYVFIYEVSGVTTTGATTGTGAGDYGVPVSTTPTTFQSGAFLLAILGNSLMSTGVTAGSGFTLTPDDSASEILGIAHAQYSTSGVSSPTTFPATFSQSNKWVEAGIALNPIPVITLVVSPSYSTPGQSVKFSGTITPGSADTISLHFWYGFGCPLVYDFDTSLSADSSGNYQFTTSFPAGRYSVYANDLSYSPAPKSLCVNLQVGGPPPVTAAPVGGVVMPTNTFALVSPWLAVIGLIGCIGTAVVVAKKRRS